MAERTCTCPECGTAFRTTHPFKKWCSRPCTVKGNNTVQNGKKVKAYPPLRCPGCSEMFTPTRRTAWYCARRCKDRVLYVPSPAQPIARACEFCGGTFHAIRSDARTCSGRCAYGLRIGREYERACDGCGLDITGRMGNADYCEPCAAVRLRAGSDARNASLRGGATFRDLVDRQAIFVRDNWRCGLCRKRIGKSYRHPHPRSVSLDHIIPLSRGGLHRADNVQAAHLICNLSKNNRGGGEQLLLIG